MLRSCIVFDMENINSKIIWNLQDNPAYSKDGIDLTLIRWMLSLTPTERLQVLQQHITSVFKLRHAKEHTDNR